MAKEDKEIRKMRRLFISSSNLVLFASLVATISILFFYFADIQEDKAEYVLFIRAELMETIRSNMDDSDTDMLLYKISNEEDTQELILSTKNALKARENLKILPQLNPKYLYYKDKEKFYRYIGLSLIVVSIISNAFALLMKNEKN